MEFPVHIICTYLYLLGNIKQITLQNSCVNLPSQQHFMENGEFPFPYILTSNWYCQILDSLMDLTKCLIPKFAFVSENIFPLLHFNLHLLVRIIISLCTYWLLVFFSIMSLLFLPVHVFTIFCLAFLVFILLFCRNVYPV